MGVILLDTNAGRSRVSRPASPGSHLWWDRLRGALADLAVAPPGRPRAGGEGRRGPALPALYQHTPDTLAALGRVTQTVAQPSAAPPAPGG